MPENLVTDDQQTEGERAQEAQQPDEAETTVTVTPKDVAEKATTPEEDSPAEDNDADDEGDHEHDDADDDADSDDEGDEKPVDVEKLQKSLRRKNRENENLRARAKAAEAKSMRYEVAAKVGLPANMTARLVGSTAAELEEDAKELMKVLSPSSVLGFVPDDGRRRMAEGTENPATDLAKIGARIYEN